MLNGLTAIGFVPGGEYLSEIEHRTAELRFSNHRLVAGETR